MSVPTAWPGTPMAHFAFRRAADSRAADRCTTMRRVGSEEGSSTIVVVALMAVLVGLGGALAEYSRAATAAERVRVAADQAALAGAAVVLGVSAASGGPCAVAESAAKRNGGELVSCRELSNGVQVEVARHSVLGFRAQTTARAGARGEAP